MSHGVHPLPSPPFCWGVEPHTKFSKEGELDRRGGVLLKKKNPEYLMKKNPPTCEEGGGHLGNSFWHLLMTFEKNPKKRILKK